MRLFRCLLFLSIVSVTLSCSDDELPARHGQISYELFSGTGEARRPLVVGLGGSEGGNAWASDRWKSTRDKFISKGYAFMALSYFGSPGTPDALDRISIDSVYAAIKKVARGPGIDSTAIALIGGSKGSELALLLASRFPDISCVVAVVPGSVVFPALTLSASTSSWSFEGREVPFVPVPWSAVPDLMTRDLRSAFGEMLEDSGAVNLSRIEVEKIRGSVLMISAQHDEMWPSREMSEDMMTHLRNAQFEYAYKHIVYPGGHLVPFRYYDSALVFMEKNFIRR